MRLVRFEDPDHTVRWGRLVDGAIERVDGTPFDGGPAFADRPARELFRPADVRLMAPAAPTKIVGIGRNFGAHAAEMGNEVPVEPLVFLKAPSSLLDPGSTLFLPPESLRVDWEGELAVVIGRRVRRLPRERWREAVLGFTVACVVTARDLQKKDVQFARAKSFDGFCPLGPFVDTDYEPGSRTLVTRVDGVEKQRGHFGDLIFGLDRLIEHVSAAMTLEPGDLILTGTPEGVGPMAPGNLVEVEIEGLGMLAFGVEAESR